MDEERIEIGGVRLWTVQQGEGPPLMLSNGGPGCCDYLEPIARMIEDLARVHRWEQRGCGRSDATPPYDHTTCIADLEALRLHFGYDRWIVGGHSWGANLSLAYALEHPERVIALLYLAGTGITDAWSPEFRRAKQERSELLPEFAFPHNQEVNTEGNRSWKTLLQDPDLPQRVRNLRLPVLIVQGELDLRPNWPARQLADLLPDVRYEEIEGAEHCLWLTHPEQVRAHLRAFLKEEEVRALRC
jgi:proline iminopeptidase